MLCRQAWALDPLPAATRWAAAVTGPWGFPGSRAGGRPEVSFHSSIAGPFPTSLCDLGQLA